MKFDKFTLKAQEALATAQQTAMAKNHTVLTPLHLLHALCQDSDGMAPELFKKIGANLERVREMTEAELTRLPQGNTSGQLMMPDPALPAVSYPACLPAAHQRWYGCLQFSRVW